MFLKMQLGRKSWKKITVAVLTLVFLIYGSQLNGVFIKKAEAAHTENKSLLSSSSAALRSYSIGSARTGSVNNIRDGNDATQFLVSCTEDNNFPCQYEVSISLTPTDISRIELKHGGNGTFTFTIYYSLQGSNSWIRVHGPFTRSGERNDWIDVNLTNVDEIVVAINNISSPFTESEHHIQEFRAFGPVFHSLNITKSGDGSGTVTSFPA